MLPGVQDLLTGTLSNVMSSYSAGSHVNSSSRHLIFGHPLTSSVSFWSSFQIWIQFQRTWLLKNQIYFEIWLTTPMTCLSVKSIVTLILVFGFLTGITYWSYPSHSFLFSRYRAVFVWLFRKLSELCFWALFSLASEILFLGDLLNMFVVYRLGGLLFIGNGK